MIPAYRSGQLKYLVGAGDSIANAYALPTLTFGYQRHTSDMLGGQSWLNKGVNGQSTTSILARYTNDVYHYKPSIVLVEGGTNDYPSLTTATSIQNLKDMITGSLANGVLLVVWLPITPNSGWTAPAAANAATINSAVSAWVTANYPPTQVIEVNVDQPFTVKKTIDGLHPSAGGYTDIGTIIGNAILDL
jgi:lysophospholipase L1-like esterase